MLKNGLITEEQYAIIDTKMLEKYRPLLGTLFSESTCYSGLSERCIVPERS
ncbi:MAG: SHOCT domain-containing protein [Oscillospiraceae bacterium]